MESEGITKVITIHLEGNMNIYTKFHGTCSTSCFRH